MCINVLAYHAQSECSYFLPHPLRKPAREAICVLAHCGRIALEILYILL